MDMIRFQNRMFACAAAMLVCVAWAPPATAVVDRIVAIVNSEAVTSSQLRDRVARVRGNLQKQGV